MATPSHANAVKSLNKSPGGRRFVFKTFSQRVEEIEINVYRSLDPVKLDPSKGSSFFRDCLTQWRELNTAEDFISFYEEMLPLVQTLPLVLLHKEVILSKILSRLQMKARLSLEPMLRLLAALSRDLLEDFFPFLPRIVNSLVCLLKSGADREPEIIEQIFTSWSYVMMYMQKYLTKDIINILKITTKLRYYPKEYIQEFMAEAMSFLLRNAPVDQLIKGITKTMLEVVRKSTDTRKIGASSLLFHAMKGTSSRFHSKAERVLQLLMDSSTFSITDKVSQGSDAAVEVVADALRRVCEELETREFNLLFECLSQKLTETVTKRDLLHLSRLLTLVTTAIQTSRGHKISDYQRLLKHLESLVQTHIIPSYTLEEKASSPIVDKILQLMLCVVDGLYSSNKISAIPECLSQWAPVFKLKNSSLLTFTKELLQRDPSVIYNFRVSIMSTMNYLIEISGEDAVYLLLSFCKKLQPRAQGSKLLNGMPEEDYSRICEFLRGVLCYWVGQIRSIKAGVSYDQISETKLAQLWGVICCYPHILDEEPLQSRLMGFVDEINKLLVVKDGVDKITWQSLMGATLNSYNQLQFGKSCRVEELTEFLDLAKRYKSSSHILSAVADYLDSAKGPTRERGDGVAGFKLYHPELAADKLVDALGIFADNLCHSDKMIRVSTLRFLCHYEPLGGDISARNKLVEKKIKDELSLTCDVASQQFDVLQLLFLIETTPLSISTSRKVILLISRIQMGLSSGWIPEPYIPITFNGIIGIFHNRFSYLWGHASECLALLMRMYMTLVWDKFIFYFDRCQLQFQILLKQSDGANANLSENSSDLVEQFKNFVAPPSDNTSCATILSQLLQSLQKVSSEAEARSRRLVPLFLRFLGYDGDLFESVGSFNPEVCKGKEWKAVLKEWLNLFKLMRNPKAFYKSPFLKEVLQNRLLDENDAETQTRVLDCLLTWKDEFLLPYEEHLKKLINSKDLREELTTWSISRDSDLIEEGHRGSLVPIVIRLLIPKVRKLKTLASRKHTSVHHRKAILGFIAQLDVDELPLFFALLIKPLHVVLRDTHGTADWFWPSSVRSMDEFLGVNFLKPFTEENICALSWKKRYGFLHVIEDVLGSFDEFRIKPFLNLIMGCVVRILKSCNSSLEGAKSNEIYEVLEPGINSTVQKKDRAAVDHGLTSTALKQFKDLRSLCLKVVSHVLNKFENPDLSSGFWDLFFAAVKSLIDGFKQEGSSSEKPSSLFSCFLAMSRSPSQVSLLSREKNLVPDIFSILSVPTASDAIVSCVLKFIENLLDLDGELDEDDNIRRLLIPNLEGLVFNLHCLFTSNRGLKRKLVRYPGETVIGIFSQLSKYIKDAVPASKFIDILLPLLSKKSENHEHCLEAMKILRDVISVSGTDCISKIITAVSPLLTSSEVELRLCICDLLDALAEIDPSVLSVAKLLRELNATSATELGGLDYDVIMNAYEKIGVDFFRKVKEDHILVILSHFVYDMSSEELILRHSAYRSLLSFVEFSSLIIGQDLKDHSRMPEAVVKPIDGHWTKAYSQRMICKFLLKHLGNAMGREASGKKEWVDLLRAMILRLPEIANLGSFKALCSEDAEIDFFNNIVHLQRHRRARALVRFRNVVSSGRISEGITNKVFVPLFFHMLFDIQDGKGENVRSACIEALASISGQMEWKSYYALLNRCFHEMTKSPDKQKVLLRLVCSILDQFHFSDPCSEEDSMDIDAGAAVAGYAAQLHRYNSSVVATDIQKCLHKSVLPKIQKLLESNSDKVNVNVSLAALKLLKLLPADTMDSQLSSIIYRLSNFLKSRLESIRDEARSALAACLKELGFEYLQFIVKVMQATLKRGYEMHVLGYTLNFILSKSVSDAICGKLDYCLNDLLSVVVNDILGDVAEEKEVEKIASKMKETRKSKSFETLRLIAQYITFKNHAMKLLAPVTSHSQKHLSPKLKSKLENMLSHIAAGIECNPSVHQTDLFVFIYGLVKDGIVEETGKAKDPLVAEANSGSRSDSNKRKVLLEQDKGAKSQCSHLITVFALGMLHNRIKNLKLNRNDEQLLSMLDPFAILLGSCLSSKFEDVLSISLRCLTPLVRLPLPSLEAQADKMKISLMDITQHSSDSSSPLMESCLRLLTVLLRSTSITLSSDQLHLLIQFPLFVDLERNPSFVALSLLKAIVNRKLVVHEIYDVVTRVAELMVTSQIEPVRKKCSQILLQFLLDYRLSEKRLQQHLDFLLANLRYEHPTGREAVLEMLHAIIMKFPQSVVDEQSQTLFVHLVVCLANDHDNKVRSMAGAAIKLLIGRISPQLLNSIFEYGLSWYLGEKQHLWSAAAQVLGLLVEALKKGVQKHFSTILSKAKSILQSAVNVASDRQLDPSAEVTIPFWKEAYFSLVLLEKMLCQFHELCLRRDLEDIWEAVCEFLLHPHMWLRTISSRLVAIYFSTATEAIRQGHEKPLGLFFLMAPSRLFLIAVCLCCQLKAQLNDDSANNMIAQNLVFTICGIHSFMKQMEDRDLHKFWSTLEQDEQARFLKAFQLLDSKKGRGLFTSLTSGVNEQNNPGHREELRYLLVSTILKRMGKIALEMDDIQVKIIFSCFDKISLQLGQDDCICYGYQLVLPLYKVCEDFAGRVISDEVKQMAHDLSEKVQNILGSQNYVHVYNRIRKDLKAKRDKRKQEEKLMAVVNPMRNAKRKLRIAAKHRAHKKRKLMSMKMSRWNH